LQKSLASSGSLLDIGCGYHSPAYDYFKDMCYTVGIDGYDKAVADAETNHIHTEQFVFDVRKIGERFEPKTFDCTIALDLIEHLTKEEGEKLIADMESIACKTVVIFTPNGFIEQEGYDNNVLQIHKSGWTAADFRQKGYSVVGVNGLKALRTHEARLRFKPGFIWHRISYLTQMFVRNRPENAYQIFCVKKLA